jgi:diguanylate cyclase (GGDEF)-like protein
MPYLILIILANFLLYFQASQVIKAYMKKKQADNDAMSFLNEELERKEKLIQEQTRQLSGKLEGVIEIYDVTKDICKSLEVDGVFNIFKDKLKEYIDIDDCRFIKDKKEASLGKDYFVLPLNIENKSVGSLAVKGIKKHEEERFNILTAQFFMGLKRALLYQQIQELAITDSLTAVFSRRYFMEKLNEEIERATKFNLKFAFLMADIDHFKEYNDRYGHLVGDVVLKEAAATIKESVRQIDVVGRYGGEEFAILLPETSPRNAYFAAERIRKAIAAKRIRAYDEEVNFTISIGFSAFPRDAKDGLNVIDKADIALYQAKQKGRNEVVAFGSK